MRQTLFEDTLDGITIDRIIRDYDYTMPTKHVHDEYEIYYLVEGERFYFIGQRTYHIKKGDLVFINKNTIHKTSVASTPHHDRILIEFSEEPFKSFFSTFGDLGFNSFFEKHTGVMSLTSKEQSYVKNLLLGIHSEIQGKKTGYRLSVMNKLALLMIFAIRRNEQNSLTHPATTVSTKHKKIEDVASYIIMHYTEPLSLESIADTFYINKCYLSRIFKEVTSFTVNEFINIQRINKAQELLTSTTLSITKVAEECGYESLTYFEKVFRTYRETSPLKYRNKYFQMNNRRTSKGDDTE